MILREINRTANDSAIPVTPTSIFERVQMLGLLVAMACGEEDLMRLCETQ